MEFLRVWFGGYARPLAVGGRLVGRPAPLWGLYAQSLRAALDALVLYLPLALLGREPSTPLWVSFLSPSSYYATAVWLAPPVLLAQWLLGGAVMHLILRLAGARSDFDQVLNVTGMAALVIGAFLVPWDWLWFLMGWHDPVLLGVSHLVVDIWAFAIILSGFRALLGTPFWLNLGALLLGTAAGFPLALLFMRPPF